MARRTRLGLLPQFDDAADGLPLRVLEALWRASQEGLAKVEKHTRTRQVSLQLRLLPGWVEPEVDDVGIGLPHPSG